MAYVVVALYAILCTVVLLDAMYTTCTRRVAPVADDTSSVLKHAETWAFDESSYSFFTAALYSGSASRAIQGLIYVLLTLTAQVGSQLR